MEFDKINYLAVLVAAIAGFAFGAAWYMSLSKPWLAAAKIDPAKMAESGRSIQPFIVSFIMLQIMAAILSIMIGNVGFGEYTWQGGMMMGFVAWLGFAFTTTATNHRYEGFGWTLTVIDVLHWLGVALIMGAIIGWWGLPEPAPAG
jgi:hypothetical protein